MNIIVCLDDKQGMAFNNRRQSKDRYVREKIIALCENSKLYMNSYSFGQFEENADNIIVDEAFFDKAEKNDFCFAENIKVPLEKADKLYIFLWNRLYPSDLRLDVNFEESGFSLISSCDFKGYSHKKITLNIYERKRFSE